MHSTSESELSGAIYEWVYAAREREVPLGITVEDALAKARELRRQVGGKAPNLHLSDPDEIGDILHALCLLFVNDCTRSPQAVLAEAGSIYKEVRACRWAQDELDEHRGIACSLAFICWRAARLLELSREVQRWESEYRHVFQESLQWQIIHDGLGSGVSSALTSVEDLVTDTEAAFQVLLYVQDQIETVPDLIPGWAKSVFGAVERGASAFPPDLQQFLLGEAARVAANGLRLVGTPEETEHWLDLAEEHVRAGVNPQPQLARITFLRLALLYSTGRCEAILSVAPRLDSRFAQLGMDEDRVKCRILWSASLKFSGRCQEALEVLEPLRPLRSEIRPALYGWLLLHSGDTHQMCGNYERALEELTEAARLLGEGKQLTGLADINSMISVVYRAHGLLGEAVELLRSSQEDHARLGMRALEANNRILVAETYLAMGRLREAELEVRAALPILEEQGLIADALAGVSILREALRRLKVAPNMLGEDNERLRPKR